ncbi:MAG: DUF4236 domain-containing protein [Clostridiales bacterium]|nr:DUF4236 domain-containing protein [Clostridiales bacterium]
MGLNFRKSITILPGVRLNLSKGGVSASFGKKGLRQTISSTGRATTSIGIPGTGVYYTKSASVKKVAGKIQDKITGKGKDKKAEATAVPAAAAAAAATELPVQNSAELEENRAQVAEYEAYVESLKSVHKQSDGQIDWEVLNKGEVPTNIVKGSEEYKEWQSLQEFSQRVMDGDIDSYFEIIDEVKPFDDLLEFGSNFQVGTDRADHLEVEFAVKSEEIIPVKSLSLTATGKLSEKEIGKTAYYDLMQDYVCSTVIRVARDAFALLPVDTVIVHAVDNVLNTATGYEEELTLVSVKFDRAKLMSLNMSMIDPSDAIGGFENHMKFKKTAGFDPVERISI